MTKKLIRLSIAVIIMTVNGMHSLNGQDADSLTIKIGQMIMLGMPGKVADTASTFYAAIKAGKIGGLTIYESHLTEINAAENLASMLKAYQQASPIPMFTAITQEGGIVNRLKTKYGFPPMPSAQYLGILDDLDSTKYYADNSAFTLSRLGININFAPVVDIYMANNPVLGSRERCYSADPLMIVKHASQVILSHDYFNVHTAIKHFPGHGSSDKDSHLGLTDVSRSWSDSELLPYKMLLEKKLVRSVMTAHIVNRQLDSSSLPATLSKKIITGLLRTKLGFNGVVFSDDMQMKAISNEFTLKDAVEKSINAGVDVLLFSGNISGKSPLTATALVDLIGSLVAEGKITAERIDQSYRRILHMKKEHL